MIKHHIPRSLIVVETRQNYPPPKNKRMLTLWFKSKSSACDSDQGHPTRQPMANISWLRHFPTSGTAPSLLHCPLPFIVGGLVTLSTLPRLSCWGFWGGDSCSLSPFCHQQHLHHSAFTMTLGSILQPVKPSSMWGITPGPSKACEVICEGPWTKRLLRKRNGQLWNQVRKQPVSVHV